MNNKQNCLVSKKDIEGILNYYSGGNVCIKNLDYYQKAFVHESYYIACKNTTTINTGELYLPEESNERLEFMGDNTLKYIIGMYLYERFPNEREGVLTKTKIKLEKTKMLHKFAVTLNFSKWLLLSEEVEAHTILSAESGRNTKSFYENAFEAFIGSIVLDQGVECADTFVRDIIENIVDFGELMSQNDNFKDSIQRYFQSNKWHTPKYVALSESGPGYRKLFTRVLFIECSLLDSSALVYSNLNVYTSEVLNLYKSSPELYKELFDKVSNGYFVLGVGTETKVVEAEQLCAKCGLMNFGLSDDY